MRFPFALNTCVDQFVHVSMYFVDPLLFQDVKPR